MILTVPIDDGTDYPTLGPQVCDFIQRNLPHGPGDMLGRPVVLDDDWQGLIYRMYEVHPRSHPLAGRRRFDRVALSMAKGLAKTELAALITVCELSPDGPVRCTGWTAGGDPIGGPVTDPYIPLVAFTEEQSDELCYSAVRLILLNSSIRDDFYIDMASIERRKGEGKAVALSTNPSARDGARTTFMVLDETHRWLSPRHKRTATVMYNNLPKRKIADPWGMETTTAFEPGTGSVAEDAMDYALAILDGKAKGSSFFFFHRQASSEHDITTETGAIAAVEEASGSAVAWRDIPKIVRMLDDPKTDAAYWERVYCNRLVKSGSQAFDVELWKTLKVDENPAQRDDYIVLGFDGAVRRDTTGLVATHVLSGFQWVAGVWECPLVPDPKWTFPVEDVVRVVDEMYARYNVWRMYADPPFWQLQISRWVAQYGKERVVEWGTNRPTQMAQALENFDTAITEGHLSHDGDERLLRHIANARRRNLQSRTENDRPLWVIQKDRPDSFNKIDLAMAAVLSWEARTDAIAAGVGKKKKLNVFFMGGAAATR